MLVWSGGSGNGVGVVVVVERCHHSVIVRMFRFC